MKTKPWVFNIARVLEKIREAVILDGGQIVYTDDTQPHLCRLIGKSGITATVHQKDHLAWTLDGVYYSLNVDNSPFVKPRYIKRPLCGAMQVTVCLAHPLSEFVIQTGMLIEDCSGNEVDRIATYIIDLLAAAKPSETVREATTRLLKKGGFKNATINSAKERTLSLSPVSAFADAETLYKAVPDLGW